MNKWNKCSKQMPKDGEEVEIKTKSGKIYNAIYCEDPFPEPKMNGWMIQCNMNSLKCGKPIYWRKVKYD